MTSSYARPRVHHESREVRGEEQSEDPNTRPNFNGVWNTVTDQGNKYVVTLRQRRSVVTGRYEPLYGLIRGAVKDNVLRFTWRQEDGGQGNGPLHAFARRPIVSRHVERDQ